MPVEVTDLEWYKSENVNNTATNGGRMGNVPIVGGLKNNIFPDVSQQERQDGLIASNGTCRLRKVFAKNKQATGDVLVNPVIHMKEFTPGQDYVEMIEGTQTDVQSDINQLSRTSWQSAG